MKLNDKFDVSPEFADLFAFETKKEELQHEASILAARFLSEINKICEERGLKKKDLAKNIGTSASYITQIFTGDKQPNMLLLAKFQDALDIVFEVKAKSANVYYNSNATNQLTAKVIPLHKNKKFEESDVTLVLGELNESLKQQYF